MKSVYQTEWPHHLAVQLFQEHTNKHTYKRERDLVGAFHDTSFLAQIRSLLAQESFGPFWQLLEKWPKNSWSGVFWPRSLLALLAGCPYLDRRLEKKDPESHIHKLVFEMIYKTGLSYS